MKIKKIIELLDKSKVTCDHCKGVGRYEHEYWNNLYEERECYLCNGTGKDFSKEDWQAIREFTKSCKKRL